MFPAMSLGFTIFDEIFAYVFVLLVFFFFNPTIEVVTFHLHGAVHAGCVFVAGIHLSRT